MKDSITTFPSNNGTVWKVPLPNNPHYPYTLLHHRREDEEYFTVLIANLDKLLACYARDSGEVIAPYEQWERDKAEGLLNFMRPSAFEPAPAQSAPASPHGAEGDDPHSGSVALAQVHINVEHHVERPGLLGRLGLRRWECEVPVIGFTNGRHRTRFMHAMGVTHAPMLVDHHQVGMMRRFCCD